MYNYWVKTVVESGLMDDYIILDYPKLVQVKEIRPDKTRKNYKILPKREAIQLIEKHPHSFEIIELDIEKIKLNDLNKSRSVKNGSAIKPIRNRIFYLLSFLFLAPLFSKSVRTAIKRYIDANINVITFITGIVMIILMIVSIYIGLKD